LGPTVGSGVQDTVLTVETSTLAIACNSDCTLWLPTYRPTVAGPNAVRLGTLPSSCQLMENALPAGILVEAVGSVMKTVAWAKGARAARERTRREENIVMFFRVTRTSGREKESGRADGDGLNWQSTDIAAIVFAFFL